MTDQKGAVTNRPTTAAAVALAAELRNRADRLIQPGSPTYDPYAQPPYPTTASARMEVSRQRGRLRRELEQRCQVENREPLADELEDAQAQAPAAAIATLKWRWSVWEEQHAAAKREGEHRDARHARRQRTAARDREAARKDLSIGQRIDQALASLATIQCATASGALDAVRVTGSRDESPLPKGPGDPAGKAKAIARDACRQVEDELESARRRRVESEAA